MIRLVVTDIDGTILGGESAGIRAWSAWVAQRRASLRLVYASGRLVGSVRATLLAHQLPEPDAVIGGVGSEIHLAHDAEPWPQWTAHIDRDWDRNAIQSAVDAFGTAEPQPAEVQSAFKLSYFARDVDDQWRATLRSRIEATGSVVSLIYSSNRDLDLLPARADKGQAAAFLAAHWGIAADEVIVAGDSGNDLPMFEHGFRGIVVSNAQPELARASLTNVYRAARSCAAGVLEGLVHWEKADQPNSTDAAT